MRLNHENPPVLTILRNISTLIPQVTCFRPVCLFQQLCMESLYSYVKDSKDGRPWTKSPLQVGLPRIPRPGSRAHVEILRQWLQRCDKYHTDCNSLAKSRGAIPSRLIDVGPQDSSEVRLYETCVQDSMPYLALSHRWGSQPHFCTSPENLQDHKKGISLDLLPPTFRHAVQITRRLGFQYLWIDSICIVQGPKGDFNTMAKRMEDVFSRAYCVLAACSSQGQRDGFLWPREQRVHRAAPCGDREDPVYLCEFVDNFQSDVLESPLSKRAWVFQERALARRTIFFTERQTYWECGDGIQCETLTKLQK